MNNVYTISIDNVPTAEQVRAEFDTILKELAGFTPTQQLTAAIRDELVTRITRQISFRISAEPKVSGMDGERAMTKHEVGVAFLEASGHMPQAMRTVMNRGDQKS
ncbi:hypothetical protein I5467_06300 [Citrobacter sp. FDAARGOS_156]|uniref:hypothetical protein n=1 Tax=Citrobacter sp. FDAARGOS_156 TaxID=1702170 RepID=UPI001901766E|nr:hypothetical protein [Citrobacter sp. FDAARGOS_156]MBJ9157445.1 hypothetical protein [Citrobacter sp. FDAARGOS_156]